tara:strand:- start:11 stop:196 length:186 start_codon:yes stop_codon:yes gene_type:complete
MKMQTNKQITDEMFDTVSAINKVSRTGNLYGKLFALKDMQIYLQEQVNKIEEEIKKGESNE